MHIRILHSGSKAQDTEDPETMTRGCLSVFFGAPISVACRGLWLDDYCARGMRSMEPPTLLQEAGPFCGCPHNTKALLVGVRIGAPDFGNSHLHAGT